MSLSLNTERTSPPFAYSAISFQPHADVYPLYDHVEPTVPQPEGRLVASTALSGHTAPNWFGTMYSLYSSTVSSVGEYSMHSPPRVELPDLHCIDTVRHLAPTPSMTSEPGPVTSPSCVSGGVQRNCPSAGTVAGTAAASTSNAITPATATCSRSKSYRSSIPPRGSSRYRESCGVISP
ncbi:hypothetical protein EDB83DRAFT_934149 [Lactarius deliciosus]|nr:hypothetical protein EDB83DRAFT_934149 [Lactarius deliciosus]